MARLIERFQAEASGIAESTRKSTRVHMPENLYRTLCEIHRRSLDMAERLLEVMADDEHEFFMAFGRARRKNLPDLETMRAEIVLYALFLKNFDTGALPRERTGFVTMRADTAFAMAHMLHYNNQVLASIREGLEQTGYMKIFTEAKASGLIYSGKTALAEVMNLAVAARIIGSPGVSDEKAMDPGSWPVFRARKPEAPPFN